LTEEAKRDPFG